MRSEVGSLLLLVIKPSLLRQYLPILGKSVKVFHLLIGLVWESVVVLWGNRLRFSDPGDWEFSISSQFAEGLGAERKGVPGMSTSAVTTSAAASPPSLIVVVSLVVVIYLVVVVFLVIIS